MFKNYIAQCGKNKFYTCSNRPTLDEAKGKTVIIGRSQAVGCGVEWYTLRSADRQHVRTLLRVSIGAQFEDIAEHLEQARSLRCPHVLSLTYCSGNSRGAYPDAVADRINSKVYSHITRYQGKQRWGVVVMDFPELGIIHKIIDSNRPWDQL